MAKYNQEKAYEELVNILTKIYEGDKSLDPEYFKGAEGIVVTFEQDEDYVVSCQIYPFNDKVKITSIDTPSTQVI